MAPFSGTVMNYMLYSGTLAPLNYLKVQPPTWSSLILRSESLLHFTMFFEDNSVHNPNGGRTSISKKRQINKMGGVLSSTWCYQSDM